MHEIEYISPIEYTPTPVQFDTPTPYLLYTSDYELICDAPLIIPIFFSEFSRTYVFDSIPPPYL